MQAMRCFASQYEFICHIDYTLSFAHVLSFSHVILQIKKLFFRRKGSRLELQITHNLYSRFIIIERQCSLPNDVCLLKVIMFHYTDVFYRKEVMHYDGRHLLFCWKSSCYNDANATPGADMVAKDLALVLLSGFKFHMSVALHTTLTSQSPKRHVQPVLCFTVINCHYAERF